MKYLTIFQIGSFESAASFATQKEATEYIHKCAKAAKTSAFENQADSTFLLEPSSSDGKKYEINVSIRRVDTKIQYELTEEKNGQTEPTTYYSTRETAVEQAQKVLDELGYDAAPEENHIGQWSINNPEQNLVLNLCTNLVVMGSEGENVVATYSSTDMLGFCQHFDQSITQLDRVNLNKRAELLKAGRKKGLINLGIGIAITLVGILLSVMSYQSTKPGQRYTVFTGLIVVGIIDAICGIYYIINPKATIPKDKK